MKISDLSKKIGHYFKEVGYYFVKYYKRTLLSRRFWQEFIIPSLVAFLASILASVATNNYDLILSTINARGAIFILPLAGIVLFGIRYWLRFFYGSLEFFVGYFLALRAFDPNASLQTFLEEIPLKRFGSITPVEGVTILGGLYVMVRGLDNISKSPEWDAVKQRWRNWRNRKKND